MITGARIGSSTTFMAPAEAESAAAKMNADPDDDWSYKATHDPQGTGYSFVEVRDEDGAFVGKL